MGTIAIRLKPGARQDRIGPWSGTELSVAVTAPPIEGRANGHLIKLLAKPLGVPRSACTIIKGTASRTKVVAVEGLDGAQILERLVAAAQSSGQGRTKQRNNHSPLS